MEVLGRLYGIEMRLTSSILQVKITNDHLALVKQLAAKLDIRASFIKGRLRWSGHIARLDDKRLLKKVFVADSVCRSFLRLFPKKPFLEACEVAQYDVDSNDVNKTSHLQYDKYVSEFKIGDLYN